MENKKNGEDPRITISIKKSTAAKFDLLRIESESWNQFLEEIYPLVASSRKHLLEEKLEALKKEISHQGKVSQNRVNNEMVMER